MFSTLYQIAKNTFRESLREPIFLLILLSALVLIGLFPVFTTLFVFSAYEKMVIDSAMATMMVFGWGLAIMISSYAISREIDNGTALLLLSKPVQRPVFIIAKILGIMGATSVFCIITALATMVSLRVSTDQFWIDNVMLYGQFVIIILALAIAGAYNYVTRSSFCMAAVLALLVLVPIFTIFGQFKPTNGDHIGLAFRIIPALFLITLSIWSMGTLATALSTRFSLVPNLLLCAALFMLGLMSDYLVGRSSKEQWERTPPAGTEQLWICDYTFAPQELADVDEWNEPKRIEDFGDFIVWTDSAEQAADLPDLGTSPAAAWKDGHNWCANLSNLKQRAQRMGVYDATKQSWKTYDLGILADARRQVNQNFEAIVFRRSPNPPRLPKGGTFLDPRPDSGNFVATALYAAIPNWQLFWMADALSSRGTDPSVHTDEPTVPVIYVAYGTAYAVIMNVMLTLLAILLFWNREAGKQLN